MTPPEDVHVQSLSSEESSSLSPASSSSSSSLDRRRRLRLDIPSNQKESSFTFGVIADVQWADEPDGSNYAKTVKRCYRGAFQNLQDAVKWWNNNNENNNHNKEIQFIAQLGDLIDGLNRYKPNGESDRVLSLALEELDKVPCPSVNIVGNHELYNFDRAELAKASWLQHGDDEYYSFIPAVGWKVIVLDPYQISLIGHTEDDPRRLEAERIISKENPNVSLDGAPSGTWFDGIEGYQKRFCPYNGGYGTKQLRWFQNELHDAVANQQRVVIFSHVIIHPKACGGGTMAWDYEQALEIIYQSKGKYNNNNNNNGNGNGNDNDDDDDDERCCPVVAVLCGHDHSGNYHCDEYGIHHCTFISPLNKGEEGSAFGLINITPKYMEIRGPKLDDFLPDVKGRPNIQNCCLDGDDIISSGPCESLRLPIVNTRPSTAAAVVVDATGSEREKSMIETKEVMTI